MRIYLFGYAGQDIEAFTRQVISLNALVFDIRFSPASRAPQWERSALLRRFGCAFDADGEFHPGSRYAWIRDWGNRNYKGGPIDIQNLHRGLAWLRAAEHFEVPAVILMCVCRGEYCHRYVVADYLRTFGYAPEELVW